MEETWGSAFGRQVSSLGRVYPLHSTVPYYPQSWRKGYAYVTVDGKQIAVHRLVATAFLGEKPSDRHSVDHINGDTTDNRVSNLRWALQREQRLNQRKHAPVKDAMPVEAKKGDGEWVRFTSLSNCCRSLGIDISTASKCVRGKRKSTNGFVIRRVPCEEIEGEAWTNVHGIDISSMGRIKNKKSGTVWTPTPNVGQVYCYAINPKGYSFAVHRLVALGFIGNPPNPSDTVDHRDRNPSNNRVSNLAWASQKQQNVNRGIVKKNVKNFAFRVRSTDCEGVKVEYNSARDASRATGVAFQLISRCCHDLIGTAGGMGWEFC